MPTQQQMTRRQVLVLAGISALTGTIVCSGSALVYLLLRGAEPSTQRGAAPTPPRSTRIKHIERPPIITRQEWGARAPNHDAPNETGYFSAENAEGWLDYPGDLRDVYRTVIVHHSVEYETDDITTVRDIQALHMDDRGWADIAYHFVVGQSGQVFEGRALNARGTHVEGYNTGSVGVVFLGDFERNFPTPIQLEEGRRLINWLALRLELTHLASHHDFNADTVCPGSYMMPNLAGFAASAGLVLGTGGYTAQQAPST